MNTLEAIFYHFTFTPLIKGVPGLIKKVYESGHKLLIVCRTPNEMNQLDRALWTFAQKDFLPHCMAHEKHLNPQATPILLSLTPNDNKNEAEVVLSLFLANIELPFKKHLYAFCSTNQELQDVFELYNQYKTRTGITSLTFWQQEAGGKWNKK